MIGEHDDGPTTTPVDDLRQQLSPRAAREASEAIRDATNDPTASASAASRRPTSRSGLVAALRDTVNLAPPTVKVRTGGDSGGDIMDAAASFGGTGGACQLYEPKAEQEQAARISELQRQLAKAKLKHQQIKSTSTMALSQVRARRNLR